MPAFILGDVALDVVDSFVYLGSCITADACIGGRDHRSYSKSQVGVYQPETLLVQARYSPFTERSNIQCNCACGITLRLRDLSCPSGEKYGSVTTHQVYNCCAALVV